jgi:hypothetical protein
MTMEAAQSAIFQLRPSLCHVLIMSPKMLRNNTMSDITFAGDVLGYSAGFMHRFRMRTLFDIMNLWFARISVRRLHLVDRTHFLTGIVRADRHFGLLIFRLIFIHNAKVTGSRVYRRSGGVA